MEQLSRYGDEIQQNLDTWRKKPALQQVYRGFHQQIARRLAQLPSGYNVELGSGIGNIQAVIPDCIRTDLFPNPWIDQVENAYQLSFADDAVANLILFDVFHHLRYPGSALQEFYRVLADSGRLLLFEPCLSLLGLFVYGPLHSGPLGLSQAITWFAGAGWFPADIDYYAAQGNASRIFLRNPSPQLLSGWSVVEVKRLSAISYMATGGYSKPQLYPLFALPLMRAIDAVCDWLPWLFATRLLVVLEKKPAAKPGS
ncbi:methyltransferase domain-containing protein [Pseudanabaena sp. FACHB-2040]|uniref:methyltransferase domain-containing protein n=1 Tax=Pseudanabaena sp. FACHB-2040 TaxID=2692859 RepID=UPI00168503B8|nr:methyltransferase domain-containing protein [Pseudanabaena sp. FACHB-2040]MBD2256600.1 methyltransferase domain-containing protein [Pseudanabaena sp. FACHB-2040]